MTQQTTNYKLQKYEATDAPNLVAQYNTSMDTLDVKLKEVSDRSWSASDRATQNAAKLNALGVTDNNTAIANKTRWDKASTDAATALQKINDLPSAESALPAGLKTFCTALGLTGSNATELGTTLKHLLNRTAATQGGTFTAKNLADAKVTEEGLPFVPAAVSARRENE